MPAEKDNVEDAPEDEYGFGDEIDTETFDQILEMDDGDDDHEFSKTLIVGFYEQCEATFEKMDTALKEKNLPELSALGHFLKGSSATLGLTKVKDGCEEIQHYGSMKDKTGTEEETNQELCLSRIESVLKQVKRDYKKAKLLLDNFYEKL